MAHNDSGMEEPSEQNPTDMDFDEPRYIKDNVWDSLEIPYLCSRIMDTPQFKRLKSLKQLGALHQVYPSATHSRFEHCIGVCFLCGKLLDSLKKMLKKDFGAKITKKDKLCVQIAGLCHDLGHGPLSHSFDGLFIPAVTGKKWHHELASVEMLKFLLEQNPDVKRDLEVHGGLVEDDFIFIYELILGGSEPTEGEMMKIDYESADLRTNWPCKGRPFEKSFLYEIVSNSYNGVDMDKFDYVNRDATQTGLKISFSCDPCSQQPRVRELPNGLRTICYRDKSKENLVDLFATRTSLHRRAYQNRTAKIVQAMYYEVMRIADKHLLFPDSNGGFLCLSESINDMMAYSKTNDNIFYEIERRVDLKGLDKARRILTAIDKRKFFRSRMATLKPDTRKERLGKRKLDKFTGGVNTVIAQEIVDGYANRDVLKASDFIVTVAKIDYGMANPLSNVWLYSKNLSRPLKKFKPDADCRVEFRVTACYKKKKKADVAMEAFERWCAKEGLEVQLR